jgi:hypothetical protein
MSKNTEYIYSNQVVVGEDAGTPYLVGRNQKLKTGTDIVAEDRTPVITYTDSTNTIDFHNKAVVNFTGGGGGGDALLAGGSALTTPQVFTGFNRMTNDCQFADGVLFSDDGTIIKGKIHATATALHIETDDPLDKITMKLDTAGATNTLELKEDPLETTQNGLFIQQVKGSTSLDKVLTNSLQDLGVIVDSVEVSPNTFTNTNTFSTTVNTNGINNTGIIASTSSIATNNAISAGQSITGNELISNGNVTCAAGSNFIVGTTQIASDNLSDFPSILNTSATPQVKTGNLVVGQLTSSAGVLNFDTTGGANIQNDTSNNVLITSTTNATDGMNWRLGTGSDDTLKLRYDANGGGVGVPRYFLEMLDPSVSPGPSYFQFSGNSTYDVATLIGLLNNTSFTFNATTTTTFNGSINYPQPTFTTFAGGGYYVGAPTTFIDTASRFPVGILTETYGTTSKITMRGCCELRAGGTIAANTTIASLPVSVRPSVDVVVAVQGQSGSEQGRVDFLSNGNVDFIGPDATFTQINFSQISYFLV